MNNEKWSEHLEHWKTFLNARLCVTEDAGEQEKIKRQLSAVERVKFSAVLNPRLLIDFINPEGISTSDFDKTIDYHLALNDSQKHAVCAALSQDNLLTLIQGPPGTGKTQVITEICLQLFHKNPDIRILICSETHVAVNNIITRIAENDESIRVVRIKDKEQDSGTDVFSSEAVADSYKKWLVENCNDPEVVEVIKNTMPASGGISFEKAVALSANVVGMTCNRVGAYRFLDTTEMFDYAIIDEVCKATLPEILMPLIVSQRAVLVGDPKQLPPVFCSEDIVLIESIDNCNLNDYMYIDELFKKSKNVAVLDIQYRMEKSIANLISDVFYDSKLKNGRNVSKDESLLWIDYVPSSVWPDMPYSKDGKAMIRNLDEVDLINRCLKILERKALMRGEKIEVAVIAPYRHQISILRQQLPKYQMVKIDIDTVDGLQGKERNVVIFGLTRTVGSYRFLADKRRLNVALSRAKDQIIIVGNLSYAKKNELLETISARCKIISI